MICDYHLHTGLSYDSKAGINEVISTGINLGMKYMAVTDHHDFELDGGVFEQSPELYYDTIDFHAKKYADKITVARGIELGIEACYSKRLYDFVSRRPFDFVIGSIHSVDGLDPYYDAYWEGLSVEAGMQKYFKAIYDGMCAFDDFDVLGHIDYAIRYARDKQYTDYRYSTYAVILDLILKKAVSMGKGIEVNSAGLRKGLKNTNPCREVIEKYHEYGGRIITIGSDAHTPEDIGKDFEYVRQMLKSIGFEEYHIFINRKAIGMEL